MKLDIINETFKRVDKALDLRFEKDTSLYIDKKDTDEIKENISKNRYQNISAFAKKIGDSIVTKVILKNSWLVEFSMLERADKSILNEIFTNTEDSFFIKEAGNVINDNIYSSIEFKQFIEKIYYKKKNKKDCNKIYLDDNKKIENRALCFIRHLKEVYINDGNSSSAVKQFINIELNNEPNILAFLNKNSYLGEGLFDESNDQKILSHWIVNDQIKSNNDSFWIRVFTSIGSFSFHEAISYIIRNFEYRNPITKLLIVKVLPKFALEEDFNQKIVNLYRDEDSFSVKILLIRMLRPPVFKDKEQAQKILGVFETAFSFRDNWMEDVNKVKEWNTRSKKVRFENQIDFYENVESNVARIRRKDNSTLSYFNTILSKTRYNTLTEVFDMYENSPEVEIVLCYYFANLYRDERRLKRVNPEDLGLSSNYIDSISYFIGSSHIKTENAKRFLAKYEKFDILSKLDKR